VPTFKKRVFILTAGALFATSACGGNTTVPTASQLSGPSAASVVPNGTTSISILKTLTKDVEIGSTVDPKNGDMGPRAITRAKATNGLLKEGQLVVCNFEDSAGTAGKGTTIEILDPKVHSKPSTFTQNAKIEGCDGNAVSANDTVYGAGLVSGVVAQFNDAGVLQNTYGPPIQAPLSDADAFCGLPYAPENIYVSDSKTGSIVKLSFLPISGGKAKETQVITGFATNKGSGWSVLGPSGLQYNNTRIGTLCNDTLYIVDGVDNTIVAVEPASQLLFKNEIVVQPGGKTFKCNHKTKVCATLVYSGAPLDAPVASALLPNGNLVVANSKGGNKLVELSPKGQVLDTKVIDKSATAHIFGLAATLTATGDTVLYYTDTKTNTLQELHR
jgi:hypothetical protein